MIEKIKYAAAAAFALSGFVGYYMLDGIMGTASLIVGLLLALLVFLISDGGRRFISYAKDSVAEVKKVVWPTRKETIQTTLIVFVFVVCVALFLWIIDAGLVWVINGLILKRTL